MDSVTSKDMKMKEVNDAILVKRMCMNLKGSLGEAFVLGRRKYWESEAFIVVNGGVSGRFGGSLILTNGSDFADPFR